MGMWAAVVVLACAGPPSALTLPPGMAPIPDSPTARARVDLPKALSEVGPAQFASKPRGGAPAPGSATESEAIRRYVRAQVRVRDGQVARASDDLDAALRLDPSSAALHAARAATAADAGDLQRAVAEWEAVLATDPKNLNAAISVGAVAVETGHPERAIALLGPLWGEQAALATSPLNESGRYTLGSALARALLRMGYDSAAIGPAVWALQADAARMARERGDGLDATARLLAALGRDAGEAAIRMRRWDDATALLVPSIQRVPETRTEALAAYAALRAGRPNDARSVLHAQLSHGLPNSESAALVAEWILTAIGGDPEVAVRMSELVADVPSLGRAARLLAAADPAHAAEVLDDALAALATDRHTIRAAFASMPPAQRVQAALRMLRAAPSSVRTVAHELVRMSKTASEWRAVLGAARESPERQALLSACQSYARSSGEAWALAERGLSRWTDEPVLFFARIEAAAVAADPSLVQNATVDASDILRGDADWHAAVARAAAATGLQELASASLARCEALAPSTPGTAQIRAVLTGVQPEGSLRSKAEQALSVGDLAQAVGMLMEAYTLDPADEVVLGMLSQTLPRLIGDDAALAWVGAELERAPSDPLLWDLFALLAIQTKHPEAALARVDQRITGDATDSIVLSVRAPLLRATGRAAEALAAARLHASRLPPGPRRALAQAAVESQGGDAAAALDALQAFAESAYPPPMGMRLAALEVCRKLPESPLRAKLMRRVARDAILADEAAPLEFYAYEALSTASDEALNAPSAEPYVQMIAQEAAAVRAHRQPESMESWRAACDFLAGEGHPESAAVFISVLLAEPEGLDDQDLATLARAAFAAHALAGGHAENAMQLLAHLVAEDRDPFAEGEISPARAHVELADIFALAGDEEGALEILEAASALDPDDAVALNNVAYARAMRGEVGARTVELAQKAVSGRPNEPSHMDTLGWIHYLRGELADANGKPRGLTLLTRAAGLAGRNSSGDLLLHLGDAQWRSGDKQGAVASWTQAAQVVGQLDRESTIGLYRKHLKRRTSLEAVSAEQFYERRDAARAAAARARLNAAESGAEPPVAPFVVRTAAETNGTKEN